MRKLRDARPDLHSCLFVERVHDVRRPGGMRRWHEDRVLVQREPGDDDVLGQLRVGELHR